MLLEKAWQNGEATFGGLASSSFLYQWQSYMIEKN